MTLRRSKVVFSFVICQQLVFFKKKFALKSRWTVFGPHILGRGSPKFWTSIFKSGSLPNMWQSLLEFHAVISEDSDRKKGKTAAKYEYNGLAFMNTHGRP